MMISIIILTYNRDEALLDCISNIHRQSYSDKEIIVVDNGNNAKTRDLLEREFPETRYLPMDSNIACAGRNAGIKAAAGEIIVTLDDDVYFTSISDLAQIEQYFNERKNVHVLNFKIVFADDRQIIPFNWYHPKDYRTYGNIDFETDYIAEGASAFRKIVFEQSGYYPEEFFLSHEGPDLAYRIIDAGYTIAYSPVVEVIHMVDRRHRPGWRNSYYDTRNQIWLGIRNLPISLLIPHLSYRLLTTFLFCLFRGHLIWYFRALKDALAGIPSELQRRKPVSNITVKRLKQIRKDASGPIGKFAGFIEKFKLIKDYYN